MIAFVKGVVYSQEQDAVVIEAGNIGYRIYVANPMQYPLGKEQRIFTYQHVREDAILLFGFTSMEEYQLFLRLISVKGVGPKTALNMLGVCGYRDMVLAIEQNDVKKLKSLPGIGAKTAQQIVLDLKGKLVVETSSEESCDNTCINDAMEALQALGYKPNELHGIKQELMQTALSSVDAYIRHALVLLAKRKGV